MYRVGRFAPGPKVVKMIAAKACISFPKLPNAESHPQGGFFFLHPDIQTTWFGIQNI
jgi:hypothetical protein